MYLFTKFQSLTFHSHHNSLPIFHNMDILSKIPQSHHSVYREAPYITRSSAPFR